MFARSKKSFITLTVVSIACAAFIFITASYTNLINFTSSGQAAGNNIPQDRSQTAVPDDHTIAAGASSFLLENAPGRTLAAVNGNMIITNPASTVALVNKKRLLPADYVPQNMVVPNVPFSFAEDSPKKQMRKIAASALEKLFAAAKNDGIELAAVSGYRSYETQKAIFDRNAALKGEEVANRTSAIPGQSEHQTGLSIDVSSQSADYGLETQFGETKEGQWLRKYAPKYGFIIRYEEGKEAVTGYTYEPWHIRYVGVWIAGEISRQQLTLEEYLAQFDPEVPAVTSQ